ncbi:cytochrome P450 [Podospora didyma]|uniref:Cytochrome P450 monooxygenase ABA1 n=1 Tax=Podospora didyma TaxID=330526 RepID=A0AAE0U2A7_9PEZI|nr:cytochrome P450 [Podospora didyma]
MGLLLQLYELRWLLATAGLAVYITNKIRAYNRLKAFKGPFSTGWSEAWHAWAILSLKSHLKYKDVIDKYGPIARVGPNDLLTSSPELLAHMSAVRSPYTRGKWYHRATRHQPGIDHLFSELDEDKHTRRRAQLAPGFSGKENPELEASIDTHVSQLIHLIRSKHLSTTRKSKPMDLARKVQFLTLDVISEIGFGQPFGDLVADDDVHGYIAAGEIGLLVITITMALGLTPLMQIPWIASRLGPSEKDTGGFGHMVANARALIKERLKRDTDTRSDMLASFVRHGLSEQELVNESTLQIVAGSDTSAAALRAIMLYVITHPRVYVKLQAEVDAAAPLRNLVPSGEVITDAKARDLPYLNAVIKEGLRIHPPVTDQLPKRVPDGGETVTVEGKQVYLPGGIFVNQAAWPLHMSKTVFGEDADEFRPERWLLETDREKLAAMNRTHELIFGWGRYQCLGKPIAQMEIGKAVFELMRNFDWCLAKPENPWKEANYIGLFTHSDMWVLVTDRVDGGSGH